jgi:glucose/arabinose dehydrogenase
MKRTGYKVVRVPFDHSTGKARDEYEDFVTGFVTPEGKVWGRPLGITVAKDGSLLISEDGNGTIWRVSYGG